MGRRINSLGLYLFSFICLNSSSLGAQELSFKNTLSGDVALLNKYVWRGILLTDGPVLQPAVTFSTGHIKFNTWANVDLDQANGQASDINELDYTLDYTFSFSSHSLCLGSITYTFPNTKFDATTEVFLQFATEAALSPTLTVYRDLDEADGTYLSFGAGYEFPLKAWNTDLEISAAFGWGSANHNRFYYGVAGGAVTDLSLTASLPLSFSNSFSLTPAVGYAGLLSGRLRKATASPDHFIASLKFSAFF